MFILDDLLLRGLGISLKPFDMIWYLELMMDYALKEKYNLKRINNQIKENQLLFELGEISQKEHKEKHELLLEERKKTEEIIASLSQDMKIQELG